LTSRRDLLIGGACLSAALVAERLRFASTTGHDAVEGLLARLVPKHIASWSEVPFLGVQIPVGEGAEDRSYDDVLTRYYESSSGNGIMLLIAYSAVQAGETALHRPEVCYPAAGFRLKRWPDVSLSLRNKQVAAASMTASAPRRTEQLLYWSRIGSQFPTSSLDQRWAVLKQSLRGSVPDGVLVRLSTINPDRQAALADLEKFAASLVISGGSSLEKLLTGSRY
jgi:EpsI family protein